MFQLRHTSWQPVRHGGWTDALAWDEVEVSASTADSMALRCELISRSASVAKAHSLVAWVRPKQSLQRVLALATPAKQIEYSDARPLVIACGCSLASEGHIII